MAAIYLEEFAPKNALTDFIEVNINNLAAIPSIIFGLFGLLLLLSGFEIPIFGGVEIGGWFKEYRSAAFVGGIVLALMTLPTIIIAARASVRAVPPSIRAAAIGLGASKVQTVFHHVLPLAMPGIMTGTIIGMAQALGETAPLLMVGMVGFFADVAGASRTRRRSCQRWCISGPTIQRSYSSSKPRWRSSFCWCSLSS